jgi:hypothetical protein
MINPSHRGGVHSAVVLMELRCRGVVVSVTHLGPGYFRTSDAASLPSNRATLFLSIDGREQTTEIELPEGLKPGGMTPYVPAPAALPAAA